MKNENETQPLLSIVIPTRNREPYAISSIQSILKIPDPRLEIVIQDNSDSCDLETWIVSKEIDSRLTYQHSREPLSFVDNFTHAVELASGRYLCIIGDDDGVNPEIVEAAAWIEQEEIDCLALRTTANYIWPDAGIPSTFFTETAHGVLYISPFQETIITSQIETELLEFVRDGGINYLNFNLPKLYHGIVSRKCLENVKKRTGTFFGGLSPDIFASLAIACVAKNVMITNYPLTLPGACGVSASIQEGLLKNNSKRLEDAPHFRHRGDYKWCTFVPHFYSVETIWADSGFAALQAMNRNDLLNQLNLARLSALCAWANRGVAKIIIHDYFLALKAAQKNPLLGITLFAWNILILFTLAITKLFRDRKSVV